MWPRISRSQRLMAFLPDQIPSSDDARVLDAYAFFANGPDTHALAIALE